MPGMGGSTGQVPGFQNHNLDHNLILPQVAVGQHYITSLLLLNLGNAQMMGWVSPQNLITSGKIYFYRQDGTPLPVSVNGGAAVPEFSFSLDPGTGPTQVEGVMAGRSLQLTVRTPSGVRRETRELPEPPALSLNLGRALAARGSPSTRDNREAPAAS